MRPLPIRLRLTLWYFIMFAIAASLLSYSSWWMLRRTLDATVHQDLQERVDDVSLQLREFKTNSDLHFAQRRFSDFYHDRDDGKWLQISDQYGHWVYRSPRMIAAGFSQQSLTLLPRSGKTLDFVQGTHNIRAFAVPVIVDGRTYLIQTGISLKKPRALLHNFALGLLFILPAVLLPAALAGHLMSRKALVPVAAIAFEVRRISDRNLDKRLPISETADELSHLSITLNHMLERIDVAFRSTRDLTANASHELRTPLARLRTETEIALMRPRDGADYRSALERVHQDAIDMSGIIENLLTLARAEAGSEVLRLVPLDLDALLKGIVREWLPIAERLSLRLAVRANSGSLFVLGDQLSIVRLMRIWLDNACKFTPSGGSITISAITSGEAVLLSVEDTGIGIAEEHHRQVFARFYRVNGNSASRAHGAGLGLSLAAWIAEQHKTSISLDSVCGRGSRFQISLQRVLDETAVSGVSTKRPRAQVISS
jgi:heavy metal sensor kinase